jgi:short-subunit dehydrogenase
MNYALITGASSGIGRCYAEELALLGYNIIAVSNQAEALETLKESLTKRYNIVVHTLFADLAENDAARNIFDKCQSRGWQVDILVCNAGMLLFSTLTNTDPAKLQTIISLHCTTTTLLCRYFGEEMKRRGAGRILIMSSATTWMPYPTISHYSATKAYLKNFAFALWYELHRYGVSVTTVLPGAVDTPFYKLSDSLRRLFVGLGIMQRPETIARRGIRAMMRGRRRLTTGFFTRLVVIICSLIPARLFELFLYLPPVKRLLERI